METVDLSAIESLAATVAAQDTAFRAALDAEHQAYAATLDAVVAKIRPALRAISSRIRVEHKEWWVGRTRTDDSSRYHDMRGVCVSDTQAGPGRGSCPGDQNRGTYTGYDLFLLQDGTWCELKYSGAWTRWQGEDESWEAEVTPVTTADVARDWQDSGILEHLTAALQRQADGGKPARTKAATERAERLRAVAALAK